jgi:hypothetical protein
MPPAKPCRSKVEYKYVTRTKAGDLQEWQSGPNNVLVPPKEVSHQLHPSTNFNMLCTSGAVWLKALALVITLASSASSCAHWGQVMVSWYCNGTMLAMPSCAFAGRRH